MINGITKNIGSVITFAEKLKQSPIGQHIALDRIQKINDKNLFTFSLSSLVTY